MVKLKIPTFADEDKGLIHVLIESPKGSRNKYAYDPKSGLVKLKKVLPAGMVFPFDFGSIPGTEAEDGDPLDALVLMQSPVVPLCLVEARVMGVIEAEQEEDGKSERNDRVVAMIESDGKPAEVKEVKELNKQVLDEIERFFVGYNELVGKKFKILGYEGRKRAMKLIERGRRREGK